MQHVSKSFMTPGCYLDLRCGNLSDIVHRNLRYRSRRSTTILAPIPESTCLRRYPAHSDVEIAFLGSIVKSTLLLLIGRLAGVGLSFHRSAPLRPDQRHSLCHFKLFHRRVYMSLISISLLARILVSLRASRLSHSTISIRPFATSAITVVILSWWYPLTSPPHSRRLSPPEVPDIPAGPGSLLRLLTQITYPLHRSLRRHFLHSRVIVAAPLMTQRVLKERTSEMT
jgi:hypothetical protein